MALPVSGVRLVAEGAAQFYADLGKSQDAMAALGKASALAGQGMGSFAAEAKRVALANLNDRIAQQSKAVDTLRGSLADVAKQYGETSPQAQRLAERLGKAENTLTASERRAGLLVTELARLENGLDDVGKEARDADKDLGGFKQAIIGAQRYVGELAVMGLQAAGQALFNFGKQSLLAAGNFEEAMIGFEALAGGELQQAGYSIEEVEEKFLALGESTRYSAMQASEAATELYKGGASIEEIMGGATDATLALAGASGIELGPAAEIVAKNLAIWGDEGETATSITDLLTKAANSSTVEVGELAQGIANAGGAARAVGLSYEELTTTLGLIAPAFSSSSEAGNGFKTFLGLLAPTTEPAKEAMRELGLYTDEAGSAFYDNQGQFVGMEEATRLLSEATADLSEEQRILAFRQIFGEDSMRVAIQLAGEGADGYNQFAAKMRLASGAVELAEKKNRGFNFAMDQLASTIETVQIKIGKKLLPMATAFINDFLIPAVQKIPVLVDKFIALTSVMDSVFKGAIAAGAILFVGLGGIEAMVVAITAKMGALGIASAAVAAPLALIAVSVGAIVIAVDNYNDKVQSLIEHIRTVDKSYGEATAAIELSNKALSEATLLSDDYLTTQREVTALLAKEQREYDRLAEAYANAINPADSAKYLEQLKAQSEVLDGLTATLGHVTQATTAQQIAAERNEEAMRLSREGYTATARGMEIYQHQLSLTTEQLDALAQAQADAVKGAQDTTAQMEQSFFESVGKIAALEMELQGAQTEEQRKGIAERLRLANEEAVAEELIQRESLGRQLIAYMEAKGREQGVSEEAITAMRLTLQQEYGIMESSSAEVTSSMIGDLDAWAASGGENTGAVVEGLRATTEAAFETDRVLAETMGEYELFVKTNFPAEGENVETFRRLMLEVPTEHNISLFHDFMDGKISVEEFLSAVNTIPETVSTSVELEGADHAISSAFNIGAEVSKALGAGITSQAGIAAAAMSTAAGSVLAAARNTFEIRSPPKTFIEIGESLPDAIGRGVTSEAGTAVSATTQMVGDVVEAGRQESVGQAPEIARSIGGTIAGAAADGVAAGAPAIGQALSAALDPSGDLDMRARMVEVTQKVIDAARSGLELLQDLRRYVGPAQARLEAFSHDLGAMLRDLWQAIATAGIDAEEAGKALLDTTNGILSAASQAAEVLGKLQDYAGVSRDTLLRFSFDLRDLLADFWHRAQEMQYLADESTTIYAETAEAVVSVIGGAVDGLTALLDYVSPTRETLLQFSYDVRDAVADFWHRAQEIDYSLDGSAEVFAGAVGAAVGTISQAVEGFTLLSTYTGVPRQALLQFIYDVRDAVADFWHRAQEINYALNDEAVPLFADAAGAAVGAIGQAVEAFTALGSYTGTAPGALQALGDDILRAVSLMVSMAAQFDVVGVDAAALFADAVGRIIAPLGGAIDLFGSLVEYEGVAPGAIALLGNDMAQATAMMIAMAAVADTEGVEAAALFADAISRVFGGLGAGVETLALLKDYEAIPPERLAAFRNDFYSAVGMMHELAGAAQGAVPLGEAFAQAMDAYANAIRAGLDSISALDGLTASATVTAGVTINGGTSSGDAPTPMYTGGDISTPGRYLIGDNHGRPTPYSEIVEVGAGASARVYNAADTRAMLGEMRRPIDAGMLMQASNINHTLNQTTTNAPTTITNHYNYEPTYASAPVAPSDDFYMMRAFSS